MFMVCPPISINGDEYVGPMYYTMNKSPNSFELNQHKIEQEILIYFPIFQNSVDCK